MNPQTTKLLIFGGALLVIWKFASGIKGIATPQTTPAVTASGNGGTMGATT